MANQEQISIDDYHMVTIYYYDRPFAYKLDVIIPREKELFACANENIHIRCDNIGLADFMEEKLQNVIDNPGRVLCLKIMKHLAVSKIRRIHVIRNKDDNGTFLAEVEVGARKVWVTEHSKPHHEGATVLKQDLGENVMVRLSHCKIGDF